MYFIAFSAKIVITVKHASIIFALCALMQIIQIFVNKTVIKMFCTRHD